MQFAHSKLSHDGWYAQTTSALLGSNKDAVTSALCEHAPCDNAVAVRSAEVLFAEEELQKGHCHFVTANVRLQPHSIHIARSKGR